MNCSSSPIWILRVAGRGLDVADLDLRARAQALGLEPRQQPAVLLGLAHDLARVALGEVGQRDQFAALRALLCRGDGPAVRAALRIAELRVQALDHVVRECRADAAGELMRLGGVVVEEVARKRSTMRLRRTTCSARAVPSGVRTSRAPARSEQTLGRRAA